MTFKTLMISAATAALFAGNAYAESHTNATDTESEQTEQMETNQSDGATENADSQDSGSDMQSGEQDTMSDSASEQDSGSMSENAEETAPNSDSANLTDTDNVEEPGSMEIAPELVDMTVGDILGLNVVGMDDETIGEIDHLVSGTEGPEAVIGIGGFLGLGEYTVALPLSEFDYNAEEEVLVLGTDKETLKERPEFDETGVDSLPDDLMISDLLPIQNMGSNSQMGMETGAATTGGMSSTTSEEQSGSDMSEGSGSATMQDGASSESEASESGSSSQGTSSESSEGSTDQNSDMSSDSETESESGSDTQTQSGN